MPRNDILDDFDFGDNPFLEEEGEGEVVAKFFSVMEAEVAAARLRSEGIPCFLANVTAHSVMPHLQIVIRLHTRLADSQQARAILAEAAIDTGVPSSNKGGNVVLIGLAVLIGVLLAAFLVRAMYGYI